MARAEDAACAVMGLRGAATVERAGVRTALVTGASLSAGDTITTGAGARVKLKFGDGSEIRLGENSSLRINVVEIDAEAGTRNILLSLPIGLLRAAAQKISKSAGSSFEIHTGVGYSAVRGTHWIVDAEPAETRVYVQEGKVAVGADFQTKEFPQLVEGGHWISVTRKLGIGDVQDTPPATIDGLIEETEAALAPGMPDIETVTQTASNAFGGTTEAVASATGALFSTAGAAVNETTAAVSNVTGAVTGAANSVVDQTTSTVSTTTGAVGSAASAVVGQATSAVSTTTSSVAATVTSTVSTLGNTVNSATGGNSSGGNSSSGGSSGGGSSGGGSSGGSSGGNGGGSSDGGSSGSSSGGTSSGGSGSSSSGGSSKSGGGLGRTVERTLGGLL